MWIKLFKFSLVFYRDLQLPVGHRKFLQWNVRKEVKGKERTFQALRERFWWCHFCLNFLSQLTGVTQDQKKSSSIYIFLYFQKIQQQIYGYDFTNLFDFENELCTDIHIDGLHGVNTWLWRISRIAMCSYYGVMLAYGGLQQVTRTNVLILWDMVVVVLGDLLAETTMVT